MRLLRARVLLTSRNSSGGWQHPIHVHFEEFQTPSINGRAPATSPLVEIGRKDVFPLGFDTEAGLFFRFRDFLGRYPLHCHNHIGNIRYGNEPRQLWAACPGMARPGWIARSILWVDWAKPAI